jgi:hypothetical protein
VRQAAPASDDRGGHGPDDSFVPDAQLHRLPDA